MSGVRMPAPWVRAVLVTLPEDTQRRAGFAQQRFAVQAQVAAAADLRTAGPVELATAFDVPAFRRRYGRDPAPAEAGCAVSHHRVWADVAADPALHSDDLVLVCEDDARFLVDPAPLLSRLVPGAFDVLLLGHNRETEAALDWLPIDARRAVGEYGAGPVWPNAELSTMAYLLRVDAARAFVARGPDRPGWVADDTVVWRDAGLRVWALRPAIVIDDPAAASTVQAGRALAGSAAIPGGVPRHRQFWHRRARRQRWWFRAERVRGALGLSARTSRPVRLVARLGDDLANAVAPRSWLPRRSNQRGQ